MKERRLLLQSLRTVKAELYLVCAFDSVTNPVDAVYPQTTGFKTRHSNSQWNRS
jgi:hypothetical protein